MSKTRLNVLLKEWGYSWQGQWQYTVEIRKNAFCNKQVKKVVYFRFFVVLYPYKSNIITRPSRITGLGTVLILPQKVALPRIRIFYYAV